MKVLFCEVSGVGEGAALRDRGHVVGAGAFLQGRMQFGS